MDLTLINSKTVDFQTVMGCNPCPDFPADRIADIFGGRETCTIADVFAESMRQDEHMWVALREFFFTPDELKNLAMTFVLHVRDLMFHDDPVVRNDLLNATLAANGDFDTLPVDRRHDRWETGATEVEKRAALAALWAATARANTKDDKDERMAEWNLERDYQVNLVKEKAGIYHAD